MKRHFTIPTDTHRAILMHVVLAGSEGRDAHERSAMLAAAWPLIRHPAHAAKRLADQELACAIDNR
jgi:hypothetical protein